MAFFLLLLSIVRYSFSYAFYIPFFMIWERKKQKEIILYALIWTEAVRNKKKTPPFLTGRVIILSLRVIILSLQLKALAIPTMVF